VLLKQERKGGATPELIPLITARMAVFSESDKQEKLNASRVKTLTGSDDISARALYGHQLTFRPNCKIIMLTNHKPQFDISDQAMLDRLKLIPFVARFEQSKKNKDYVEKMMTEHIDEIFSWIVEGAFEWYTQGTLTACEVMTQEMDKYVQELDVLSQFMEDQCTLGTEFKTTPSLAYQGFVGWCAEGNVQSMSKQDFAKRMKKKGFVQKKSGSKRWWEGFRINETNVEEEGDSFLPLM
jgi:putative DNA primase/helicase